MRRRHSAQVPVGARCRANSTVEAKLTNRSRYRPYTSSIARHLLHTVACCHQTGSSNDKTHCRQHCCLRRKPYNLVLSNGQRSAAPRQPRSCPRPSTAEGRCRQRSFVATQGLFRTKYRSAASSGPRAMYIPERSSSAAQQQSPITTCAPSANSAQHRIACCTEGIARGVPQKQGLHMLADPQCTRHCTAWARTHSLPASRQSCSAVRWTALARLKAGTQSL